jgi:hypothetical protein
MIVAAVTQAITLIKTVVATPHVLNAMPLKEDMTLLKAAVVHDGRLHFWTVLRPQARLATRGGNLRLFDHQIDIEGRIAFQGSVTQQLIDNEADSILETLAANANLNGTVTGFQRLELAESQPYAFYNQAVHYARIEIEVQT